MNLASDRGFASADAVLGGVSAETFRCYTPALCLGCSRGPSRSERAIEREREQGRMSERGKKTGSSTAALDMKPQKQICLFKCASAIACKAARSCC